MALKSLRDPKRRPVHPGAILREDVLPTLKMTQKECAA
jgi:antitoxin HigA-1